MLPALKCEERTQGKISRTGSRIELSEFHGFPAGPRDLRGPHEKVVPIPPVLFSTPSKTSPPEARPSECSCGVLTTWYNCGIGWYESRRTIPDHSAAQTASASPTALVRDFYRSKSAISALRNMQPF